MKQGETNFMWAVDFDATPDCEVVDLAGHPLELSQVDGDFRRSAGKLGDWVATFAFIPAGAEVTVTCAGPARTRSEVVVTAGPSLANNFAGRIGLAVSGLLLAIGGLLFAAAAAMFGLRTRRSSSG